MKLPQRYLIAVVAPAMMACGGDATSSGSQDASTADVVDAMPFDAGTDAGASGDDGSSVDAGDDGADAGAADAGPLDCVSGDGGSPFDAAPRFHGSCAGGCPAGTVCAVEIGGVAGGGGEYCAPIPDRCRSTPTCACLGDCACGASFGRLQACSDVRDQDGGPTIQCDNGIR